LTLTPEVVERMAVFGGIKLRMEDRDSIIARKRLNDLFTGAYAAILKRGFHCI